MTVAFQKSKSHRLKMKKEAIAGCQVCRQVS